MAKFWWGVGTVFAITILLLTMGTAEDRIHFTDLETECQFDRSQQHVDVSLQEDNSVAFEGHFPVYNTKADLNYDYQQTAESVTLDIKVSNDERLKDLQDRCEGSVVYKASTDPLEPGLYNVEVKHRGERVYFSRIRVR